MILFMSSTIYELKQRYFRIVVILTPGKMLALALKMDQFLHNIMTSTTPKTISMTLCLIGTH